MWFLRRKKKPELEAGQESSYPVAKVDLEQIKQAVRKFEANLAKGIHRTVLIQEGNRLDTRMLAPYLQAIPEQDFYMSKHTYEIFAEADKMIPYYLDLVQEAVDRYIEDKGKPPVISGNLQRKINYDALIAAFYLKEKPPIPMYLTTEENLISHRPQE
ncbi:MAG TPA: DUF3939 domain-containing protein [Bacilli bacterium]